MQSDTNKSSSAKMTQQEWSAKKAEFKNKLSRYVDVVKPEDDESLISKKRQLFSDIESLEQENHDFNGQIAELQQQIISKRAEARNIFKRSDELKNALVRFFTEENNLINEIKFLETEQKKYNTGFIESTEILREHISSLGSVVKEIKFIKGEIRNMREKMYLMEIDVTTKYNDIDGLDSKMISAKKALIGLQTKMKEVEKKAKLMYYTNRLEAAYE
jgi:chromosome segregation ATPase